MSFPTCILLSSKPFAAVVVVEKDAPLVEQLQRVEGRARLLYENATPSVGDK